MDKRTYYVSVQSRSILPQQGDGAYEFEIAATEEEIAKLSAMFKEWEGFDNSTLFRAPIPGLAYHHDIENDGYDDLLKQIYRALYDLGTEETRNHIGGMDLRLGAEHEY
jgi:hypothetical protein